MFYKFQTCLKSDSGLPPLKRYGPLRWGCIHVKTLGFNFKRYSRKGKEGYEGRSTKSLRSNSVEKSRRSPKGGYLDIIMGKLRLPTSPRRWKWQRGYAEDKKSSRLSTPAKNRLPHQQICNTIRHDFASPTQNATVLI